MQNKSYKIKLFKCFVIFVLLMAKNKFFVLNFSIIFKDRYGYALSLGKKRAGSIGSSPGMLSKSKYEFLMNLFS